MRLKKQLKVEGAGRAKVVDGPVAFVSDVKSAFGNGPELEAIRRALSNESRTANARARSVDDELKRMIRATEIRLQQLRNMLDQRRAWRVVRNNAPAPHAAKKITNLPTNVLSTHISKHLNLNNALAASFALRGVSSALATREAEVRDEVNKIVATIVVALLFVRRKPHAALYRMITHAFKMTREGDLSGKHVHGYMLSSFCERQFSRGHIADATPENTRNKSRDGCIFGVDRVALHPRYPGQRRRIPLAHITWIDGRVKVVIWLAGRKYADGIRGSVDAALDKMTRIPPDTLFRLAGVRNAASLRDKVVIESV